ncbi:MAG: hypothetical protein EXX96DRAFT_478420, partial [Benjaminiella poitrasii]
FPKKSVFIADVGFNSQMMCGRAWLKVNRPAKIKVQSRKSDMDCISPFGFINFTKVEPL